MNEQEFKLGKIAAIAGLSLLALTGCSQSKPVNTDYYKYRISIDKFYLFTNISPNLSVNNGMALLTANNVICPSDLQGWFQVDRKKLAEIYGCGENPVPEFRIATREETFVVDTTSNAPKN